MSRLVALPELSDRIQVLIFIGASVLLILLALAASRRQVQAERELAARLQRFFGETAPAQLTRRLRQGLARGQYSLLLILVVLFFIAYPFVYAWLGFPQPYLLEVLGEGGRWLQLAVSLLLWSPAIAFALTGLRSAWRFQTVVLAAFPQRMDERGLVTEPPPGLFVGQYGWFFGRLAAGFLLWSLVTGLVLTLALVASQDVATIVALITIAVALLALHFLVPMGRLAGRVSRMARPLRFELNRALGDLRQDTFQHAVRSRRRPPPPRLRAVDLNDALDALPPGSALLILWKQSVPVLVGLLGPFLTVVSGVLAFV